MINNQMRITGFASGLDTAQIISDLMKAERMPLDRLFQKKEWLQWQRDAYRDVNLEISKFKSNVEKLRYSYNFNGYKATSSDESIASASASSSSIPGSYDLEIVTMADFAKVTTGSSILNDAGKAVKSTDKVLKEGETSTIEVKTAKGTATIEITDQDTYESLAKKMGAATNTNGESLGLRASFDNATSSFIISSKDMGADQQITITDKAGSGSVNVATLIGNGGQATVSDGTNSVGATATGKNGKIIFDGKTIDNITSNKVDVYGINLTLQKIGKSTVKVEGDTDAIFNNIKEFVNSYNALIDSINSKVKTPRNRDYSPLTEEQREGLTDKEAEKYDEKAKQGLLYNDSILRETLTSLRGSMYTPVNSIPDGQMKLLSDLGIKSPQMSKDGKLEIDEKKLREAIANNPDEVTKLFTAEDGIATRAYDQVNKVVDKLNKKAGRPETSANLDISTIGESITDLNKQMKTWNAKLITIENRYWKQFTAMEKAISKMNEQSSSIVSMLG